MDMGYESESVKAHTLSIILRKQNSYSKKDKRRESIFWVEEIIL
jgi:hypothetical protein